MQRFYVIFIKVVFGCIEKNMSQKSWDLELRLRETPNKSIIIMQLENTSDENRIFILRLEPTS